MKLIGLLICLCFIVSCASRELVQDREYNPVTFSLEKNNLVEAKASFPTKEKDGFITTIEKSWLDFWAPELSPVSTDLLKEKLARIDVLRKMSDQITERKFTKISYEASVFFLGESEDGYIPSEHEIIFLHLFLSMLYLDVNNYDDSRVELRRAVVFLQNNPDGKEKTFDDPSIRLWMASLWFALNEPDSGWVDLRKAAEMSDDAELKKMLETRKLKDISLTLRGTGPQTLWASSGLSFDFKFPKYEPLYVGKTQVTLNTKNWYIWHQKRNSVLRETLLQSNYMSTYLGAKTSSATKKTAGFAITTPIYILGAVVVVGAVWLAAQISAKSSGGNSDAINAIIGGGLVAAQGLWGSANDANAEIGQKADQAEQEELETLKTYRMIRLLPDEIIFASQAYKLKDLATLQKKLGYPSSQVNFVWLPKE